MKQIKLSDTTHKWLVELAEKRKDEDALIRTLQDIAAEAITEMHNREVRGVKKEARQ